MKTRRHSEAGRMGPLVLVLMWAVGVPLPIILLILLIKGCAG